MVLLRFVGSAIKNPAVAERPGILRSLVAQPRIFDVISAIGQWRDLRLVEKARGTYLSDDDKVKKTHDHNLWQLRKFTRTRRAEPGYQALVAGFKDIQDKKLLIIGGRSIQEFLMAWTFGFRWDNMIGIDLFSSTKKVLPMNMEAMTFPDESFDAITAMHVLGYTDGVTAGLRECARVLKPNGRLIFDHSYRPDDPDYPVMKLRGDEVATILRSLGLEIYFHTTAEKHEVKSNYRQTAHFFGCRKIAADEKPFDPYGL